MNSTILMALIQEALTYEAQAFEQDEEVNGADLVDWFCEWRRKVQRLTRTADHSSPLAAQYGRFQLLLSATLQTLVDLTAWRCTAGPCAIPLVSNHRQSVAVEAEVRGLLFALEHGGVRITAGSVVVMFQRQGEKPCVLH